MHRHTQQGPLVVSCRIAAAQTVTLLLRFSASQVEWDGPGLGPPPTPHTSYTFNELTTS